MEQLSPAGRRGPSPSPLLAALSLPPAEAPDSIRNLMVRSRVGRAFWMLLAARVLVGWVHGLLPDATWLGFVSVCTGLALAVAGVMLLARFWGIARRRLLWRVRRKLVLSYVFIGVVPVILVVAFFLFAGVLVATQVTAFLFKRGFDDLVDEASVMAQTAAVEVQRAGLSQTDEVLGRKVANTVSRYPGVSIAIVPATPGGVAGAGPREVGGVVAPHRAARRRAGVGEHRRLRRPARLHRRGAGRRVAGGRARRQLPRAA